MRAAGSGAIQYPSPDVVAGNNLRKVAIECKLTADKSKYFPIEEINALVYFAEKFGAEPWIAVRFLRHPWYFFTIDDMEQTEKNYVVNLELAQRRGLSFEELVEK